MSWSDRLSGKEVVWYLLALALLVIVSVLLGQYVYPSLGLPNFVLPGGLGTLLPFIAGWLVILTALLTIPFFKKHSLLLGLLTIGGGTTLAIICLIWLSGK